MIKVADLGKAPLEDAVDVIRAGRRFRRRQLFQIRLLEKAQSSTIDGPRDMVSATVNGHNVSVSMRPARESATCPVEKMLEGWLEGCSGGVAESFVHRARTALTGGKIMSSNMVEFII